MFIICQDRDLSIVLQKKTDLNIKVNTYKGSVIGYSLYVKEQPIGTFDTLYETILELHNIKHCKYKYYVVNGFTDYEECFIGGI